MSRVVVAGLDLSLTSTGIARVEVSGVGARVWDVTRLKSAGKADATLAQRRTRLDHLASDLVQAVGMADLVVVEGPSFGQARQGGQHDRAGLWWLVVDRLHEIGCPVAEVTPNGRAKYGTGKGNAGKDDVLTATIRRYPDVVFSGNDEADAVLLAAMGARNLGWPIEASLPAAHLAAMDAVRWPKVTVDVPAGVLL